ncbi:hypothetical protein CCH79_00016037, partial [Gambusia affinis]
MEKPGALGQNPEVHQISSSLRSRQAGDRVLVEFNEKHGCSAGRLPSPVAATELALRCTFKGRNLQERERESERERDRELERE